MKVRSVFLSFVRLATGEVFGRIATLALFVYVSRYFGVQILGIVALAQTVASYVMELSDQGLKLIGARLLARNADLASYVVPVVLKRRALLAAGAVALGALYAVIGPVPPEAKFCVLAFDFAVVPYAFALDWVAWGLGHFGVLALWRSGICIVYVGLAIAAMQFTLRPLTSISSANLLSAVLGAAFLWLIWKQRWSRAQRQKLPDSLLTAATEELRPTRVFTLGLSNLLSLVFMNADILLLGAMTSSQEVGRYSAACKPLYVMFTGFWLLTDALYPHLAKLEAGARAQTVLLLALAGLAALASAAAVILGLLTPRILTLIYGSTLGAAGLFRILLIAMPLDFCFSLLWTVLVSRGYDRAVLYALATAAATNVALNLAFIGRFQASAAAWLTVASYALLFATVLIFVLNKKILAGVEKGDPATAPVWA